MLHYFERATPAVRETVERCTKHENFRLHFASPWQALSVIDERIRIETPKGVQWADYAILGTGFEILPAARSELAAISPYIALWGDCYQPASAQEQNPALAQYPYLGAGFEFVEKQPGSAPWLRDIHCYNYAAVPCFGRAAGDIGSMKHGIPRLIAAISKDLVLADGKHHVDRILAFDEPELSDEEIQALHTRYRD
jgi:cation diffusion facilitator CzcD-associated flavoprotein CzcO